MAGGSIGDLYYGLGLDDSEFNNKLKAIKAEKLTLNAQIDYASITQSIQRLSSMGKTLIINPVLDKDKVIRIQSQLDSIHNKLKQQYDIKIVISEADAKKSLDNIKKNVADAINELKRYDKIRINPIDKSAILAIRELVKELKFLESVLKRVDALNMRNVNQSAVAGARVAEIQARAASRASLDAQRIMTEQARAQRTLSGSIVNTTNAQRGLNQQFTLQGRALSNLKTLATTYVSIFAVKSFIQNLAQVRGEFELQQVSLRAIIRDAEAADKIFSQIKSFSVVSPFEFKDLVGYAKQLSAFQIPVNELFDTTKQLADVSAGLGVGMDRIILAYGQVKAATVLRGQELRQFTEAGIPLVDELAKKFSELEGRVVSAGDVFEKISNRMVSFEMVKDVFADLTNEGGMFYMMQEKQAESLKGKIANLADAYAIMLNDIGEANDGILKGGVEGITKLMENWRSVADAIKVLVVAYGTYKTAVIALNISDQISKYSSLTKAIQSTTVANKLLNSTLLANPWVLAAVAIAAVGTAMYNSYQEANRLNEELRKIGEEQLANVDSSISKFDELSSALFSSVEGSQKYRDAISQINRQYGEYLPNLLNEKNALTELKANYDLVTDAIYNKAKAQAYEKGIAKIQEEFTGAQQDYTSILLEKLSSGGMNEKSAKAIIALYREELEKQVGEYNPIDLFNKVYQAYFQTSEKYFTTIGNLANEFKEGIPFVRSDSWGAENARTSLIKYSEIWDRVNKSTKEYSDYIDTMFSKTGYKTQDEAKVIGEISAKYDKLKLDASNAAISQDEYNESLKRLNIERLKETLSYYEGIAKVTPELARPDVINNLKAQIKSFEEISVKWKEIVKETIGKNKAGFTFKVSEGEDQFDYLDRLDKEYKKLTSQQELIDKNLVTSPETIEATKTQLDLLKKIGEALNYNFKVDEKATKKEENPRIQLLNKELDLIKKAKDDYDKLAKWQSQMAANQNIKTIYGIDFNEKDVEARAKDVISKISAISKKEGEKTQFSFDKWFGGDKTDKIIDNLKKTFDAISKEVDSYKNTYDFYETILGITKDKEKSIDIAFGVNFVGDVDIIKYLQDKIQQAVGEGVKLDLTTDIVSKDFGEVFKGLKIPEEQKKSVEKFFDMLKKQFIDFQTEASKAKQSLDDMVSDLESKDFNLFGKGFELDISKIARDTANAYAEIDKREKEKTEELSKFKNDKDKELYEEQLKRLRILGDKEKESIRKQSQEKLNDLAGKVINEGLDDKGLKGIFDNLSEASFKQLNQLKKYFKEIGENGIVISTDEAEESLNRVELSIDDLKGLTMDEIVLKLNDTSLSDTEKQAISLRMQLENGELSAEEFDTALKKISTEKLGKTKEERLQKISSIASQAAQSVGQLGDSLYNLGESSGNESLMDIGDAISSFATFAESIGGMLSGKPEDIIKGVFNIATQFIEAEARHQKALAELTKAKVEQQRQYNLLLLQQNLLFEKGTNIFGTDQIGKAINAIAVYRDAVAGLAEEMQGDNGKPKMSMFERLTGDSLGSFKEKTEAYNKGISALYNAQVVTGHKKTGLFGLGKGKDTYSGILSVYPDLIDGENKLNKERAQSILDTQKMDEGTRTLLKSLLELQNQADEAYKEMQSVSQETFGVLGNDLSNSIVDAFVNGTDAAESFRQSVGTILEDLAKQIMYSLFLKNKFDKLQKDLEGIYATEGISDKQIGSEVTKLLGGFFSGIGSTIDESTKFLEEFQKQAAASGFDIFQGQAGKGFSEGIKSVTEDTAQLLASYLNAIRGSVLLQELYMKNIDTNVAGIYQAMGGSPNITTINTIPPEIIAAISEPFRINNDFLRSIDLNIGNMHSIAANSLAQLVMIQANTLNTANATRQAVEELRGVISPGHPKGGNGVKVWA